MHASRRSRRRSRLRVPTRTPSTRCSTGYGWLGGTPRSASTASSGAPSRLPSFVRMICVCHNRNLGSSSVPPPLPEPRPTVSFERASPLDVLSRSLTPYTLASSHFNQFASSWLRPTAVSITDSTRFAIRETSDAAQNVNIGSWIATSKVFVSLYPTGETVQLSRRSQTEIQNISQSIHYIVYH